MAEPSKRRWFRFAFSLRTLFVVVTAASLFFGWLVREWQIVRERRAALAGMSEDLDFIVADSAAGFFVLSGRAQLYGGHSPLFEEEIERRTALLDLLDSSVPWYRRLLGDRIIALIAVEKSDVERIQRLFPDAEVVER